VTDFFDDLAAIRLPPNGGSGEAVAVRELSPHVPVRKPKRTEFVRTRVEDEWWLPTTVFIDRDERGEVYFVPPAMRGALLGEARPVILLPTITTQGVLILWPLAIPMDDGRRNDWFTTAREAAEHAKTGWIRVAADMALGAYRIYRAEGQLPEPEWPDLGMSEMLRLGFRDRVIDREDHPIIRRLRGLD
jgi:hypothetical protein